MHRKTNENRLRTAWKGSVCCGVTCWTIWQNQCQKLPHHITLRKEKKEKRERNRPHRQNQNEDTIHHVDLETIIGYTVTNHMNMSRIHNDTESDG